MQDQYKLTQLGDRINKVCTDFNLLKESISWLPIFIGSDNRTLDRLPISANIPHFCTC